MANEFSEIKRDISLFLMSLRHSIDRPARRPSSKAERERFMRTIMMVEEARVRFNTYRSYREELTVDEWHDARQELLSFLNKFMHSGDVEPAIHDRRFISGTPISRDRDNQTQFIRQFNPENPISISDALIKFQSYLEQSRDQLFTSQEVLSFENLDRIIPRQQVAPVQFEIINSRIIVSSRSPKVAKNDRANIQSALEHIKGSGNQLIENLESSNCDRRLLDSVKELQSQLVSDGNIVKIGLANMACGIMSAQFRSELPDAIVAMLNSYTASISLYVAQFPEWDQFTQKAAAIDLSEDDIAEVNSTAGRVVAALAESPALADPEVPKTIAFVRQCLLFPGASSKRAALAMIRTIENLVSSILRHSVIFFSKTAEKAVEAGSTIASKVIIGLLSIALTGASGIGQAAVHAGAPWVKQAAEIVQRQIEKAME